MEPAETIESLFANSNLLFEILGTLAFAVSGLIEAARKKLDFVGMAMVAALAAFGGGTLRDVLLDRRPFFWVQNEFWLWVLLGIVLAAMLFMRTRHLEVTSRATTWPDALGLGIFAASGTQISLNAGLSPLVSIVMGIITAVFGGVLRDVVVNEIPRAFSDHQPYSVIAFIGGWVVVGLNFVGATDFWAITVGALFITGLRVLAILRGWRLPQWRV